jgi:hypothetical protein
LKSSGNIHVEREGDRVVVRSQWGNSLVGSICLGLLYIAGVIVIYLLNGEITDNLPSPVVTAGLILVGVYIMLPRRLTATFDSQERRSIRVYNFSFGRMLVPRHQLQRHRAMHRSSQIVAFRQAGCRAHGINGFVTGREGGLCAFKAPKWSKRHPCAIFERNDWSEVMLVVF